jgi:imidazolonepropionase-like amidohydrolase
LVKTRTLFDGISERKDIFIGFEGDEIKYVGSSKPVVEGNTNDVIIEADTITPGFIDSHSHIGMARSGEPGREEEANEQMKTVYPLINSLHSIYMDDPSFGESVENGVIYSTVLPGSGNIIGGKAVLVRNFSKDIGRRLCNGRWN